ncbi:ribose 5-phosphate isomerase B [Haploplasma axanthum]|uniref:Ribose-5-phosphate isomerase B n=1 Tax=Haploplasma axanthum TaxID=29552 RepID=A0A449BCU2_HAPAX|nr:ribose 5-phosphate isomerase B [Haploplasma axanthum]VEU80245.1 ribose-5-phosphate isomerase B [Haploplasma axanthum]
MKVVIGSDHAGYKMKENLKKHLKEKNVEVVDVGTNSEESVDYPVFGEKVGEEVVSKNYDFGIVVCGTGIGISIAANKVKGVRAALVHDTLTARLAKEHNDANVLAIGGRNTDFKEAEKIVDAFMDAEFEARHQRRIDLISDMEENKK